MDIGCELAEARRQKALSLEELSRRTKIPVATLDAIERRTATLPRTIHTRGFLRAFAAEVGCDPEDVIARYRSEVGNSDEGPTLAHLSDALEGDPVERVHVAEIDSRDRRRLIAQGIVTAVLVVAGGALYLMIFEGVPALHGPLRAVLAAPPADRPAVAKPNTDPPPVQAEATTGTVDQAPTAQPASLTLIGKPREVCWLAARADGQQIIYRLLNAGEEIRVDAQEDVLLRIGDAGVFDLTINGTPARALGERGQAVTVHLTPQTANHFIASADSPPVNRVGHPE